LVRTEFTEHDGELVAKLAVLLDECRMRPLATSGRIEAEPSDARRRAYC
jgi:hypothetical protein